MKKMIALIMVLVLTAMCLTACGGSKEVTVASIQKAGKLDEAFGTGTAAVISPIGELFDNGEKMIINNNEIGPISQKLYDAITGIQWGKTPDTMGWTEVVD